MNKEIKIGKVPFLPSQAGYDENYIGYLNDFLLRLIDGKVIQGGSYRLMRHGKLFAYNSVGNLDFRDETKPLMPDSMMKICSITKVFTSISIFRLAERGYIDIMNPVADYLEEFNTDAHRKITVYNLLTHTSGLLPDYGAFEYPYSTPWKFGMEQYNGNWLKCFLSESPHCPPNKEWAYSTRCFSILGEIISRISGITAEEYIIKNIVEPLGMSDTCFEVPSEKQNRIVASLPWQLPYTREQRKQNDIEYLRRHFGADSAEEKIINKYPDLHIPQTGGGLYSSLSDLTTFGEMMLADGVLNGKRIISRKSLENIRCSHLDGQNIPYYCWGADEIHNCGLGMEVATGKPFHQMTVGTYGHEGAGVSWLYVDPKEEFIAAAFLPYYEGNFSLIPIHNTKYVIWSGLL